MTFEFDPNERFIEVRGGYSTGSGRGISVLRLLLDTGASTTVITPLALSGLTDLSERTGGVHLIETANGDVTAVEVTLPALFALGQMKEDFSVSVFDFGATEFDGVLGLDFLRGRRLCLDFERGEIEIF